jgi:hypothetical protein
MIAAFLALFLLAPPPEFQVLSALASSLSEGNAPAAMDAFDKSIPNYQALSDNIFAMTAQADVSCTIDPIEQTGNVIEVDWFLKLNAKADEGPTERRQMTVKIKIEKVGKRWKITALDPPSILDPPKL